MSAVQELANTSLDACTLNNLLNVTQLLVLAIILRILRPLAGHQERPPR